MKDVSIICGRGIDEIYRIENGLSKVTVPFLVDVAPILGSSPAEILNMALIPVFPGNTE
jgi:hypothetical protein